MMSERKQLVHQVVNELRELKEQREFEPTADIDMVWVLSAPGTVKKLPEDPFYIYEGVPYGLRRVEYGIELVKEITALRLGKEPEEVTKEDIEASGPILFYNGEDRKTKNGVDLQNEDFAVMASDPKFPIPPPKVVIDHIEEFGTPSQVKGLAAYLNDKHFRGRIAVVTEAPHSVRVGRTIEQYKDLFPEDVSFVNAAMTETRNPVGQGVREVRKIRDYTLNGTLAKESTFRKGA